MVITEMLVGLREEHRRLENAIDSLERIEQWRKEDGGPSSGAGPKKRGRPLGSKNKVKLLPPGS